MAEKWEQDLQIKRMENEVKKGEKYYDFVKNYSRHALDWMRRNGYISDTDQDFAARQSLLAGLSSSLNEWAKKQAHWG